MCSRSLVALLAVGTLIGGAAAFLATPLNVSDPDVANILCTHQASDKYRDHEWITQEGIRRNIREFFLAFPPPSNPSLHLPEDATLSQLFHLYYGSTASPTRFIKAVNSIAMSNINTDSSYKLRYDPELHSDAERLNNTHQELSERFPQILSSILIQESYAGARSLLGTSLHSIQDFYSHSTWIEQGNKAILSGLGLPGYDLGTVAGPSEDVCTPCPSPQGTCTGNVKVGAGLTSGYYTYYTEMGKDDLIPKPTTGGKCSHGGSQDESSLKPAVGGINKDTPYSCFSPHHYLHDQAAELAVLATKHYLNQVLNAVGFDKYRRLFDLYLGSALSISVDTTGSMGDDISAVISQVEEIVANSSPEKYILSQFNDPDCGPVFETTDGEEFLMAVRSLTAFGGGDYPELFWCGLQLALSVTPDYGDVFCFTDAVGKGRGEDARDHQPSAEAKYQGDDNPKRHHRRQEEECEEAECEQRLTDATGGLLISASKFDVSDIVGIMGSGVETSTVMVMHQEGSGMTSATFPVDDTLTDFELRLSGELTAAMLTDSGKTSYNLMDSTALEAAGVDLITFTKHFKGTAVDGAADRRVAPGRIHTQQPHCHSPRHLLPRLPRLLLPARCHASAPPPQTHGRTAAHEHGLLPRGNIGGTS
ncbi:hypothetical protein O3P69_001568 [Scylla paramamosain]|uniref:von Willebrand factor A domain containing 7 n=1 Tax=Scylla paramamosain TaxID=85552 RepID=A0AAW0V379_SCYPA